MKQCKKMFHKDKEVHKGNNATEAKPVKKRERILFRGGVNPMTSMEKIHKRSNQGVDEC